MWPTEYGRTETVEPDTSDMVAFHLGSSRRLFGSFLSAHAKWLFPAIRRDLQRIASCPCRANLALSAVKLGQKQLKTHTLEGMGIM